VARLARLDSSVSHLVAMAQVMEVDSTTSIQVVMDESSMNTLTQLHQMAGPICRERYVDAFANDREAEPERGMAAGFMGGFRNIDEKV